MDRSQYIQKLENSGHFLFLIRPRRFGKSIFLNMLRAYYDLNDASHFDTLFDGLWIKEHPTPEKSIYQVIYFDFSRVGGKIDELSKNFNEYCGMMLESFADRYESYYYEGFARDVQGFMNALLNLNPYYLTAPEVELNHSYCDFFLLPDLMRYPMIEHSYILELKYLKTDASDDEAQNQWAEAVDQIKHYAEGPKVRLMIQDTQLHLIVVQIRGCKLEKMEEIW